VLDTQHRVLQRKTDSNPQEHLEAHDVRDAVSILDAIEQARAQREEERAGDDDVFVPADERDDSRRGDEDDDLDHDEWEETDAGTGSRGVVNGLEGDRDIVHLEHEHREKVEQDSRGTAEISKRS